MKNSIEEDIKMLEELRIANENCIKNAKIKDNPFVAIWEKQNRAIEHILSDYKRVLEMNEILVKENKELKKNYANCKGTPPPEPQLPTKTLCKSFSKKRRK